jgi:hypothetical protein
MLPPASTLPLVVILPKNLFGLLEIWANDIAGSSTATSKTLILIVLRIVIVVFIDYILS